MLGGEFRYLMPDYNGQMAGEIMPDDRKRNGDTRFAHTLSHLQQAPNLNMAFGYNPLRLDNDYFAILATAAPLPTAPTCCAKVGPTGTARLVFSPSRPSATNHAGQQGAGG